MIDLEQCKKLSEDELKIIPAEENTKGYRNLYDAYVGDLLNQARTGGAIGPIDSELKRLKVYFGKCREEK